MRPGVPSRTAWGVARRRALHQLIDEKPLVLDDPCAVRILGEGAEAALRADLDKLNGPFGQALRAFVVARSRYAEDQLAAAVAGGVRQYIVLGAGLDTFAYRNPYIAEGLRVFEVDHPATQAWKRNLLALAGMAEPPCVRYASVDFEQESFLTALAAVGFLREQPACVAWLGVTPYLTLAAFEESLRALGTLAPGSSVIFEYALALELLTEHERAGMHLLMERVARAGEPFQLFLAPADTRAALHAAGFRVVEEHGSAGLNAMYFNSRSDGLRLYGNANRLVAARV